MTFCCCCNEVTAPICCRIEWEKLLNAIKTIVTLGVKTSLKVVFNSNQFRNNTKFQFQMFLIEKHWRELELQCSSWIDCDWNEMSPCSQLYSMTVNEELATDQLGGAYGRGGEVDLNKTWLSTNILTCPIPVPSSAASPVCGHPAWWWGERELPPPWGPWSHRRETPPSWLHTMDMSAWSESCSTQYQVTMVCVCVCSS
jgi:hypothetical protein